MTTTDGITARLTGSHAGQYPGLRAGPITVPCWCTIGAPHTYLHWVEAGRPNINATRAKAHHAA